MSMRSRRPSPIPRGLLSDALGLGHELGAASNTLPFHRTGCGVFRGGQCLSGLSGQIPLSSSTLANHRVLAALGAPVLTGPLGQTVGRALGTAVTTASLLVPSHRQLSLASAPLPSTTALRGSGDLTNNPTPKLGLGFPSGDRHEGTMNPESIPIPLGVVWDPLVYPHCSSSPCGT